MGSQDNLSQLTQQISSVLAKNQRLTEQLQSESNFNVALALERTHYKKLCDKYGLLTDKDLEFKNATINLPDIERKLCIKCNRQVIRVCNEK